MQKSVLEKFITKYNLGGACEEVKWVASGTGVETLFAAEDREVLGRVATQEFSLTTGDYCILETAQLRSILNVLDDDIKVAVKEERGRPFAFNFSDGSSKATFMLAHPDAMKDKTPKVGANPAYDVTFDIDQKFMTTYTRARSALPTVDVFAVVTNDNNEVEVVLGYNPNMPTTNVTIGTGAKAAGALKPLFFNARHFREIMAANKEVAKATVRVSQMGLLNVVFEVENYEVEYWFPLKRTTV